ncbi:MAG TPA: AmmeMemoRadiSam system protein A [Anaeromyxobacteraceae bacterium]|nr:AmmeMemoRadiSam system protein A [Anaeromyxobacteraceae bacterium]
MSDARLAPADRAALLGIARRALLAHFGAGAPPDLPAAGPLAEPRGAFVTLHAEDQLRGCIGTFRPDGSLAAIVARMAVAAATEDPRFTPLRADEMGALRIGVSALGIPHLLEDRSALAVGTHGLVVRRGWNRGALLPRVAVEHGWDGEAFLKHACLKAGLPARAWLEPDTVIEVFEAEEFEE